MTVEEYIKNNFADTHQFAPIDISEEVLKRLPKHNIGIFTDPIMRNLGAGLCAVLILAVFGGHLNSLYSYSNCLVKESYGQAQIYKSGEWQSIKSNARLGKNSVLRTQMGGGLRLELPDQSNLLLRENSILELKRPFPYVEFNLIKGALLIFVEKSLFRKNFSVFAGHLEIRDIGTRFKVSANDGSVQVEVLEGKVEVRDYLEDKKILVLEKYEKAVIKRQMEQGVSAEKLLLPEITNLQEEFSLPASHAVPKQIRRLLWWRELRHDENSILGGVR